MSELNPVNLSYQAAASPLGGSYSENKLARLGLPSLQGLSFLDLGCNTGFYCQKAAEQGARRIVGVDLDPEVIRHARKACPQGEFHDGGWETLPDGPFDVVVILSAIHYARDPVDLISKVHDRMAPDGLLVLEGGLVDPQGEAAMDVLVPGWRKVGDRCRHLSGGYLARHALPAFDWRIHGPSEPRGGDDVARYVVHARKRSAKPRAQSHVIDLEAYFAGLSASSATIVEAQPAHAYVSLLPHGQPVPRSQIESMLGDDDLFSRFVIDLAFALEPSQRLPIVLRPTLRPGLMARVADALAKQGLSVGVGEGERV
jgi:SAM-dependent methyltransferase